MFLDPEILQITRPFAAGSRPGDRSVSLLLGLPLGTLLGLGRFPGQVVPAESHEYRHGFAARGRWTGRGHVAVAIRTSRRSGG